MSFNEQNSDGRPPNKMPARSKREVRRRKDFKFSKPAAKATAVEASDPKAHLWLIVRFGKKIAELHRRLPGLRSDFEQLQLCLKPRPAWWGRDVLEGKRGDLSYVVTELAKLLDDINEAHSNLTDSKGDSHE